MPSWWGKSSSKEAKKKAGKESFIDSLHRKFKFSSESRVNGRSGGSQGHCNDTISEKGCQSPIESRSPSPSKDVSRCQSFAERTNAQPLPLPGLHPAHVGRTDSGISISAKPRSEKGSKPLLFLPLPMPGCIGSRSNPTDLDGDMVTASVFSESSVDSDDPADSCHRSPQATDYDNGNRTAVGSPSSSMLKDQIFTVAPIKSREPKNSAISFSNNISPTSPKRRPLRSHVPNLQVPYHGAFCSAPDSSKSNVTLVGSGHCSSPGSGHNSGHNSMGGDMSGQLFWQQSRGSPEYSPVPSPRMTSPGPGSRIHSGAVTPIHPRAGGTPNETQTSWADDGKQQSHRLPLPPVTISNASPFSHSNSAATSPSVPRSPGRAENPASPGSRWKKGKLLGRGTFGHVYVGFNSESGEMCAMKEVTLFSDDAKSKESAKQLMQEITLLSRLRHPNIVQYYGSESVGDRLYIYLDYTQQILSGLAYLHAKNTVHRDIKGANILVDPNGRVKLADFGMAKHITGQSCPLSFKGSPYWMAPEWLQPCCGHMESWVHVLEMATTKPPWSQYEGVAAMFKIGNSRELPVIPDHLLDDGKDFIRQCLQRNPLHRPTAAQLLEHPFVKYAAPLERPILGLEPSDPPSGITNGVKALGIGQARNFSNLDSDRLAIHSSRVSKTNNHTSEIHIPRNISCPVSPIGSPLLHSRSPPHLNGRMSPSPISSPRTTSGSSTPLTGGSGAIPFIHMKQSINLQEGFGGISKPMNGFYVNGPSSYHDSCPDMFRGKQPGSHIFSELMPCENDVLGKQFVRPAHAEQYDGQSVLADRVSRQLLKDHVKMNLSLDLSPNSPLPSRTNGV
ncbi:mitogen-activated protein kinase kinase kinase YODA-like [Prunus yedoensis var. nudiflora]|uniref:mitogen-activated protein kinase kinase kinase n=1 Tax=Prunus yedoensis var. nudiflora TaxID=2094558 RepID=A0A314ZL02_PRUYE|nr:mitogen-activated protein kinase kinase kinase YODA-like [Prunus yedoensis var. nudiflora]